jgi:DNA polymerase-3 subunit delta'
MIKNEIFTWNQGRWERFCSLLQTQTLPHAFLLTGPPGIGKKALAGAMAKSLLCENRLVNGMACGHCASCHWFEAGNHPDLRLIRPALIAAQEGQAEQADEADAMAAAEPAETTAKVGGDKKLSKDISIAQIRALADFSELSSMRSGARIALIYPAETMNLSAANALLKTLEEPGGQFHFFLITDAPHRLLPTIRSRCREWPLAAPDRTTALDWLNKQKIDHADAKLAALGGAPLTVLELEPGSYWKTQDLLLNALSDPRRLDASAVAKQLETAIKLNEKERQAGAGRAVDLTLVVQWLQRWVLDVLYCHFDIPIRYHPQRRAAIEGATISRQLSAWFMYSQWLNRALREASHPVNIALFLEDCLLRYPALHFAEKGH